MVRSLSTAVKCELILNEREFKRYSNTVMRFLNRRAAVAPLSDAYNHRNFINTCSTLSISKSLFSCLSSIESSYHYPLREDFHQRFKLVVMASSPSNVLSGPQLNIMIGMALQYWQNPLAPCLVLSGSFTDSLI